MEYFPIRSSHTRLFSPQSLSWNGTSPEKSSLTNQFKVVLPTWSNLDKCPLTDECIKKMWYIVEYYSAIKKEWNWVSCRDVDKPSICNIGWSTSEREILYINTHICKKWYSGTYLQGRNRDADIQMDLCTERGKERAGRAGRAALTCVHYPVWNSRKLLQSTAGSAWRSVMTQRRGGGWEEVLEREDVHAHTADSCCTVATNTIL